MATALTVFLSQLDALLSADDDELSQARRAEMVKAAVERYSQDLPEHITEDVSGDGGRYYAISGLASWVDGFSRITAVEYPAEAVTEDHTPVLLEAEDYDDNYRDGSDVRYIYFPNHAPASGENIRITYTAPYVASSGLYSTPPADFFAICNLAAYFACLAIAAKYARSNDSLITADAVDHGGRSERFRVMAREFMTAYKEHLDIGGADGRQEHPAGTFVDWDTQPSQRRRYLFHGDR